MIAEPKRWRIQFSQGTCEEGRAKLRQLIADETDDRVVINNHYDRFPVFFVTGPDDDCQRLQAKLAGDGLGTMQETA